MDRYKKKPLAFQEATDGRTLRHHRKSIHQKEAREKLINERRGLPKTETPALPIQNELKTVPASRKEQLQRWKEERDLKKKLQAEKKKPAFKICKIQYDKPGFLNSCSSSSERVGVVTRGMAKNAAIDLVIPKPTTQKMTNNKIEPKRAVKKTATKMELVQVKEIQEQVEIPTTLASTEENMKSVASEAPTRKSFAPDNFKFEGPKNLASYVFNPTSQESQIEIQSVSNKNSLNSPVNTIVETLGSVAKEAKPNDMDTSIDLNATDETVDKKEDKSTNYFKVLLANTTEKLIILRNKWMEIGDSNGDNHINDNVIGQICSVIGQTNLLINKKFKQFSGLIADCELNTGERQTLLDDLQGFWDMMYIQVEDLNCKFEKLERIMANNWIQDVSPVKRPKMQNKKCDVTKVRVNKTQEARLQLAKSKMLPPVPAAIFSPLPVSKSEVDTTAEKVNENVDLGGTKTEEPLVRLSERMSFLRQKHTRENLVLDKSQLATLFSPLKAENDSFSVRNKSEQLIRFSDVHSLENKENATNF